MCRTMVGARDSVPSVGPLKSALPWPGRGGGVTSTGLGGFGEGAAEEALLAAAMEVICAGLAVNAGGAGALGFDGTGAGGSSFRTRTADWIAECGCAVEGFITGEGTMRFEVGDGGTEFCIFI
jgi:hypothetical protein